jgi:hypothetical protein
LLACILAYLKRSFCAEEKKGNFASQQQIQDLSHKIQFYAVRQNERERELERELECERLQQEIELERAQLEQERDRERQRELQWAKERAERGKLELEQDMLDRPNFIQATEKENERLLSTKRLGKWQPPLEMELHRDNSRGNIDFRDELEKLKRDCETVKKDCETDTSIELRLKKSNAMNAAEASFERIQEKMEEIRAAVHQVGQPSAAGDADKSTDSSNTVVHVGSRREQDVEGVTGGVLSADKTFDRMQKKMEEISKLVSLGSVEKEDEEGNSIKTIGQGAKVSSTFFSEGPHRRGSPKTKVALHVSRRSSDAKRAGASGSEIVEKSPFRPIPPPPDARFDRVMGQIDSLQSEWKGHRQPRSAGGEV